MTTDFQPYSANKDSGTEWLGRVPEHWEVRRLKTTWTSIRNGAWGELPGVDEVDVYCLRVADFDRQRLVVAGTPDTTRSISRSQLEVLRLSENDLLLEKSGGGEKQPVGAVMRVGELAAPAVCSNFVARVKVARDCSTSFMTYVHFAIYSYRLNVRSIKQTTGIQNLDVASYGTEHLAVPPLPEQAAIAEFLDRKTNKIDAFIEKKERLVTLLEEQKQAVTHHVVTRGLNPDVPLKDSGVKRVGAVPEHWEVRQLGRMGRFSKGHGGTKEDVVAGGVPCVRYGDLYTQHRSFIRRSRTCVTNEKASEYTPILYGDVLFAGSGETIEEIGKSAVNLIPGPACCGGDVILFRPSVELDPIYFGYATDCFQAAYQKSCMGRGFTIIHIYGDDLKYLWVPVPPLSEQQAIAEHLGRATSDIDTAIVCARRMIDLLNEYRISLIADVVTGKVDVSETPA